MIDIEKLRGDLTDNSYAAFFGGGFGGALMEAFDLAELDNDALIEFADRQGVDLTQYERQRRE